jgi:hypothetical protein
LAATTAIGTAYASGVHESAPLCCISGRGGVRPLTFPERPGFFGFCDGTGGVALIEVDSAATLARTIDPWMSWLRFTVKPIVPVEEATQIANEAVAFRDSVS